MSESASLVNAISSSATLQWEVGWSKAEGDSPEKFVPATVPGAVQLDWARAEGWGEYWYADNWRDYTWMEDVFWTYSSVLTLPEITETQCVFLAIRGIDYKFRISLNGNVLLEQEGMFKPVELDMSAAEARTGDVLTVMIFPAPKSHNDAANRAQANQSCKPAVSYGWDFHPRLIPLGIWEEASLEVRYARRFETCKLNYLLSDDLACANLELTVLATGEAVPPGEEPEVHWQITDEAGEVVLEQTVALDDRQLYIDLEWDNPQLWWPHDQGKPTLYRSRVELRSASGKVLDVREERIGFRTVRLVMHDGAWDSPEAFPKSRSNPPITLEINGRIIFGKGANWVSPEIFPGLLTRETYETQLNLAKANNMNLLRMWGGAVVQKESFYDLCDELGILVWQEFPLACNNYVGSKAYLEVLDSESKAIITRLKSHPSLAIWCGGNELFNAWSGMTDQSHALRLLNRNCYDLDPHRPFLMTSPVAGVGHGHYVFRDPENGQEAWEVFQQAACTAYCEFGCPGPASRDVLESIIPEADLWPPKLGTAWETHHAFGVWMKSSHLYLDVSEHYFGSSDNLDSLIERGQLLQCEGYKGLFEEARRQKPKSSMALCWCFNEPWPSAANNSLISWPSKPKPALAAVGQACRPVLASARIRKFQWREGECFDPELWLLSDCPEAWPRSQVEAWLEYPAVNGSPGNNGAAHTNVLLLTWNVPATEANTNCQGPRVHYILPALHAAGALSSDSGATLTEVAHPERFELVLRVKDASGFSLPDLGSRYTLLYIAGKKTKKNPRSMN